VRGTGEWAGDMVGWPGNGMDPTLAAASASAGVLKRTADGPRYCRVLGGAKAVRGSKTNETKNYKCSRGENNQDWKSFFSQ